MVYVSSPGKSVESLGIVLIAVGVVLLALLTLYLVGFDQGAISRSGMYLHELMHDGRHLLGVPCH
ncbi:putative membrane protein [Rhodococcus opacus]|uniref:Putative membrane protein n=1 Tax=Rhodococcus opacus TaxID=37919 RepID=A0A1B1JYQ3_RHOOP|nr:CbtB domain-containing protein [Rhodococcus opacus]ANS25458.1 putative membrane protein [Rhodococcus opacus]